MTQHEQLIDLFKRNGNRLTLSQILNTTLAAEYRARMTELRKQGFTIICEKAEKASNNIYVMVAPESTGQTRFA